jgi:TorA maturation chaperone TorD
MDMENHPSNEAVQRSIVYAVLARAFLKEPDSELIGYFRRPEVQEILSESNLALGDKFLTSEEAPLLQKLSIEYCRLFLAPPTHIPPYESFFVGGLNQPKETFEPALQGKASIEVQDFYREHGIVLPENTKLFPDHVSLELEALHLLCQYESRATGSAELHPAGHYRCLAGKFLREHPGRWVPAFCDQILVKAEEPFYRVIAQLTKAFIETELAELARCSV